MIILRQRYYSNLGLEQRNYNIITDIRHSELKNLTAIKRNHA